VADLLDNIDPSLPKPGTLVASKYRIERVLGVGGMGVVYAARHEMLSQDVALKMLLPDVAKDKEAVARFIHEGRATARLQSDHVVRVMDVGMDGTTPFLAMELLSGEDLGQILEKRGPFLVTATVDFLIEAMEGLSHAHAARIIHRDLKPSNLFLANGVLKVVDFGISKSMEKEGGLTATSAVLGSPAYMAPEQLRSSKHVDARVDVWSLGVIAFELLTGQLPFGGETVGMIFANVLEKPPPRPRTLRVEMPGMLEEAILKCLQKSADARYQNLAELAKDIARFGSGKSDALVASIEQKLAGVPSGAPIRSMSLPDLELPIAPISKPKVSAPAPPISAPSADSFDWNDDEAAAPPKILTVDESAQRKAISIPVATSAATTATVMTSRRPAPLPPPRSEFFRETFLPLLLHAALVLGVFFALHRFVPAHGPLDVFRALPGTMEGSAARTTAIVGGVFAATCIGCCIAGIASGTAKWGWFVSTAGFGAIALGMFLVMSSATGGIVGPPSGERMFVVIGSAIVATGLAFACLGKARDGWRDDDARVLPPLLALASGVLLFLALELASQPLVMHVAV
jgi:serine/threonine-protein kinase